MPDVCLTWIALRSMRAALAASLSAVIGAVAGGALMYLLGLVNPLLATRILDLMPAVSMWMIDNVEQALLEDGLPAMMVGAFIGTPYKIYAVKAAMLRLDPALFLLLTIPARLIRFVLAVLIVRLVVGTVGRGWSERRRRWTLVGFWLLFYAFFFALMPN